jgi:aldehyde:ferredoxin oxidoreductase
MSGVVQRLAIVGTKNGVGVARRKTTGGQGYTQQPLSRYAARQCVKRILVWRKTCMYCTVVCMSSPG